LYSKWDEYSSWGKRNGLEATRRKNGKKKKTNGIAEVPHEICPEKGTSRL